LQTGQCVSAWKQRKAEKRFAFIRR